MGPISMHQGGATVRSLGEREHGMRQMWDERNKHAIIENLPIVEYEGKKVFRIPKLTGYTHRFDMERATYTAQGDLVRSASFKSIEFKPDPTGMFGEIVLDPQKPDEARKIDVLIGTEKEQGLMAMLPHLGIIDWREARRKHDDDLVELEARKLADPTFRAAVVEKLRVLGVTAANGFGDLLKPLKKQEAQPPAQT